MPGTDLQGRHVLVTGAGKGIGRATALAAAQAGADVSLVGTTQGNLEEVAALIGEQGRQARVYALDVSDGEAVGRCIADAADAFGGLHGAFNNAGIDGALVPTASPSLTSSA